MHDTCHARFISQSHQVRHERLPSMFESDASTVTQQAHTGRLPDSSEVSALVREAHSRYVSHFEGKVADYIPVLARANAEHFGISLVETSGATYSVGDWQQSFTIQSISKAFVFALLCEAIGHEAAHERIGVNNTGLPFNSVIAVELNHGSPMNPMVNAGAIAATALMPGDNPRQQWEHIHAGLSRFAGRELDVDEQVYESEIASNQRNKSIAKLLDSYQRLPVDPLDAVEMYTRQCALTVTAQDLAMMGATLADGGVHPISGERIVSAEVARDTLAVLASCGLYERSGEWLFEIGLPAKSGVSGGIVAIAPGKGAIGVFSPPLDSAGNSIRGQRACAYLSRALGLNLFASHAHNPAH